MSELSSNTSPSPTLTGAEKPRMKQQKRRIRRQSDVRTTPTRDDMQKYNEHGLPSVPKNPIDGKTVPYDTAVHFIQDGSYGDCICHEYERDDCESVKRILFLSGRDFGHQAWNRVTRNEKMLELVRLEGRGSSRFRFLLEKVCDRDLLNQTIGAETNEEVYPNAGEANGKTYKECYGEQVVAILRYLQQDGAFGFLPDEEMEKLVFFFRINVFGTCYLAALCIFVSYLGQMAFEFEHITCPPDIGKLIRLFKDEDLYDYIVNDHGGDSNKVLKDMLERFGKGIGTFSVNDEGDFENPGGYHLEGKFKVTGPGLVTNFKCSGEFSSAWKKNPGWQTKASKEDKISVGLIQFDMQDGQDFNSVQGKFIELNANRGTERTTKEEIYFRIQEAEKKMETKVSLYDPPSTKTIVRSPNVGRGGDRSAHIYSPQSSPDSISSAPRHDRTAISHDNAHLDDSRDLGDESIEAFDNGESSQSQVRDRPPVVEHDDEDEAEPRHAMVCIAGRVDKKSKKLFLLLQNSWSRMPLVEVSLNYFIAAEASISFVKKKDHEFFKKLGAKDCFYEVNKSFVADCSNALY